MRRDSNGKPYQTIFPNQQGAVFLQSSSIHGEGEEPPTNGTTASTAIARTQLVNYYLSKLQLQSEVNALLHKVSSIYFQTIFNVRVLRCTGNLFMLSSILLLYEILCCQVRAFYEYYIIVSLFYWKISLHAIQRPFLLLIFSQTISNMKALHIVKYGRFPVLESLPKPTLNSIQQKGKPVLVKMCYAPINPSDIFFYQGKYGITKQGYSIVGFEGSGIVQDAQDKKLIGRKVTVSSNANNGTHATYAVCSEKQLIFWPETANLQAISMAFVNPMSCIGMCKIVEKEDPQNVLISAAASQIGKMMIAHLRNKKPQLKIFGLNRSLNKSQQLKSLGITQTFLSSDNFESQLSQKLKNKTIFFDCIGGQLAGKTFNVLGPDSIMVCYGRQSGEDLGGINLGELYYRRKVIRGFWLNNWLAQAKLDEIQETKHEVVKNYDTIYKSNVRKVINIQDFMEAYRLSIKDKSEGKVLLDLN